MVYNTQNLFAFVLMHLVLLAKFVTQIYTWFCILVPCLCVLSGHIAQN
jgi:hypothetical protein